MAGNNGRRIAPAYQWYPGDWKGDEGAQRLSASARGVFREMLDLQWLNGTVPADPKLVARLSGLLVDEVADVWDDVLALFEEVDGRLTNGRMAREQSVNANFVATQSEKSALGVESRWGPLCDTCGKRRGPVSDPCGCATGDARGNARGIPPVPSLPVPSRPVAAAATSIGECPEHLRAVVEETIEQREVQVEKLYQHRDYGKRLRRVDRALVTGALRASVLACALDATVDSGKTPERQQDLVRNARARDERMNRVVKVLEDFATQPRLPKNWALAALKTITAEGE